MCIRVRARIRKSTCRLAVVTGNALRAANFPGLLELMYFDRFEVVSLGDVTDGLGGVGVFCFPTLLTNV